MAETGRLSSTNPNLQNIPIRTPLGREIRGAFVTDPGWKLVSCDYSQVELRILAHISGEPALQDAFRRGEDVHRATAAEVFGMAPADVDRDTRDRAKAVNFGIVYGISDFGLSEQLGHPARRRARSTSTPTWPATRGCGASSTPPIAAAAQDGYVTTLFGRRRPIPELGGPHGAAAPARRAAGREHGHPGDAPPTSSRRRWSGPTTPCAEEGLRARMILQIHDELLLEAPDGRGRGAPAAIVRQAMVGAYPLDPPLAVDVGIGDTWLDAKW